MGNNHDFAAAVIGHIVVADYGASRPFRWIWLYIHDKLYCAYVCSREESSHKMVCKLDPGFRRLNMYGTSPLCGQLQASMLQEGART